MKRWWMSFADGTLPKGSQHLGCCIVHAMNEVEATKAAWARGINPGGEIRFMPIDEEMAARLSFSLEPYENRLLTPTESKELFELVEGELGS